MLHGVFICDPAGVVITIIFFFYQYVTPLGSGDANQKLSEGRAAAVKNYLVENGIDASRLTSAGFGESKPIDTNKTKAGKANNRRVEVKLVK